MGLRDKYAYAVETARNLRMQGSAEERDGKLYFHGTVSTQEDANKIWNAIKTIADWPRDIVADIEATDTQNSSANRDRLSDPHAIKAGQTLEMSQTMKP